MTNGIYMFVDPHDSDPTIINKKILKLPHQGIKLTNRYAMRDAKFMA
jgi:hypothetical protein